MSDTDRDEDDGQTAQGESAQHAEETLEDKRTDGTGRSAEARRLLQKDLLEKGENGGG